VAQPSSDPAAERPDLAQLRRVRRTPRFRSFLLTGAVLGFVAGLLVDSRGGAADRVMAGSSVVYLGFLGALVGALLAALVAAVIATVLERGPRG
jgi:hypothetical protein